MGITFGDARCHSCFQFWVRRDFHSFFQFGPHWQFLLQTTVGHQTFDKKKHKSLSSGFVADRVNGPEVAAEVDDSLPSKLEGCPCFLWKCDPVDKDHW